MMEVELDAIAITLRSLQAEAGLFNTEESDRQAVPHLQSESLHRVQTETFRKSFIKNGDISQRNIRGCMKLRIFDGCTKLRTETRAFSERGHDVVSLGIEGDVTICCDIRQYFPSIDDHYDFMTFHPPCTEFTRLGWIHGKCKDRKPDMSIVEACFRIVETCKPRYWMIENPTGCLRHFIGKPQVSINYGDYGHYCKKPTDLWGVFPWFWSRTKEVYKKGKHNHTAFRYGTRDSDLRAAVPYGLSLAICLAIEDSV